VSERRVVHWLPLAHHRREEDYRCLHLALGARRVAVCARCVGLYGALVATIAAQAATHVGRLGLLDWWITLGGVAPALFDWGLSWLGRVRGRNLIRVLTGVLAGIALGRGFWLYFRDPRGEIFWVQVGLLAVGTAAFELVRRLRL
jgi:uncharacterized membrane protein